MKNTFFSLKQQWLVQSSACFLLYGSVAVAQVNRQAENKVIQIPMETSAWNLDKQNAEFITYKGVRVLEIKGGKQVIVKGLEFSSGTIEFDVEPTDTVHAPFVSFYFRQQDTLENECVYLRIGRPHSERRNDAVQYAPFIKGVNLWNLLNHFQGPALIHGNSWNHVKLVVSGVQLRAYINDMSHPALEVPRLEGNTQKGQIAFDGQAVYANVVIRPGNVEGLPATSGADLTNQDANYLRHWSVSRPQWLAYETDLSSTRPPNDSTWLPILSERHALINVTRLYGIAPERKKRYIWLKTNIHSEKEQVVTLQLGFCDDISVFINGGLLYTDKNTYWLPIRKNPDGRCDIRNSSIQLPLKAGDNQIMVALANYFYGWGIVARLNSLEGIDIGVR